MRFLTFLVTFAQKTTIFSRVLDVLAEADQNHHFYQLSSLLSPFAGVWPPYRSPSRIWSENNPGFRHSGCPEGDKSDESSGRVEQGSVHLGSLGPVLHPVYTTCTHRTVLATSAVLAVQRCGTKTAWAQGGLGDLGDGKTAGNPAQSCYYSAGRSGPGPSRA